MIDAEFADIPEKYKNIIPQTDHVLYAQPTPECTTGTRGRVAVMEAIKVDDEIEQLILEGADDAPIIEVARKNGYITMKEDAVMKALEHSIPFEETSALGGILLTADEPEPEPEGSTGASTVPPTVDNPEPEPPEVSV